MSKKKKFKAQKNRKALRTFIILAIILGAAIILGLGYKKVFLPENHSPGEFGNTSVEYHFSNDGKPENTVPLAQVTTISASSGWDVSEIPKYGVSILHPANSKVIGQDMDTSFEYIRIQNYSRNMVPGQKLALGEYFMEILIFDQELGNKMECRTEDMKNMQTVTVGGITGYKGEIEGGDAPNRILELCISKPNVEYMVKVYEEEPNVSDKIIDSFRFTK